jgi:hypothetical protein
MRADTFGAVPYSEAARDCSTIPHLVLLATRDAIAGGRLRSGDDTDAATADDSKPAGHSSYEAQRPGRSPDSCAPGTGLLYVPENIYSYRPHEQQRRTARALRYVSLGCLRVSILSVPIPGAGSQYWPGPRRDFAI